MVLGLIFCTTWLLKLRCFSAIDQEGLHSHIVPSVTSGKNMTKNTCHVPANSRFSYIFMQQRAIFKGAVYIYHVYILIYPGSPKPNKEWSLGLSM